MVRSLFVTLRRGYAGRPWFHRRILEALGLKTRHQCVEKPNNSTIRGMLSRVSPGLVWTASHVLAGSREGGEAVEGPISMRLHVRPGPWDDVVFAAVATPCWLYVEWHCIGSLSVAMYAWGMRPVVTAVSCLASVLPSAEPPSILVGAATQLLRQVAPHPPCFPSSLFQLRVRTLVANCMLCCTPWPHAGEHTSATNCPSPAAAPASLPQPNRHIPTPTHTPTPALALAGSPPGHHHHQQRPCLLSHPHPHPNPPTPPPHAPALPRRSPTWSPSRPTACTPCALCAPTTSSSIARPGCCTTTHRCSSRPR